MATMRPKPKRRKLELYRLTISGLEKGTDYQKFLAALWSNLKTRENRIFSPGGKAHALDQLRTTKGNLWFQFFSFAEAERPEILDTANMSISENPLTSSEALLHWTHAMGKQLDDRYVILVERVQSGIWPTKMEHYFQWMIEHFENEAIAKTATADADEPISVSLEIEADASFLKIVDSMDRIVSASLRVVRPNPGWGDYEDLLSKVARNSDGQFAEIAVNARRGASLAKKDGIIDAMHEAYHENKLGRAIVEGDVGGERKRVSTEKYGKSQYKYLETDQNGNVEHLSARDKFFEAMETMIDDV